MNSTRTRLKLFDRLSAPKPIFNKQRRRRKRSRNSPNKYNQIDGDLILSLGDGFKLTL